jgi:tetrahydromethanopterin S-methyltransferase subunit F
METFKHFVNGKAAGSLTAFLFLIILAILAFLLL